MADGLIELEEARRRVLASAARLPLEAVALEEALGRTLGEDVRASDPVPPFDNSAMDGYAVVAGDTAGTSPASPARLELIGESRAGRPAEGALRRGAAMRISTGAAVPAGCDAVVRVEDTAERDGEVEIKAPVTLGDNLRRAGEDVRAGDVVLRAGARLGPAELGVLASAGVASVLCPRRPRVAVVVTGDELRDPGQPLGPGAIRDTNSPAVAAQVREAGGEVASARRIGDDRGRTVQAIAAGLGADALVICGGVSVGTHDHVKPALAHLRVQEDFWGVALKPGKPLWFGTGEGRTPVFGLPGNPVSAMVCFHLFVRPALLTMAGADPGARRITATLDEPYAKPPGRAHVVRCHAEARDDGWHLRPTGRQESHLLTSMLGADALAVIEADRGDVAAGDRVAAELLPGA